MDDTTGFYCILFFSTGLSLQTDILLATLSKQQIIDRTSFESSWMPVRYWQTGWQYIGRTPFYYLRRSVGNTNETWLQMLLFQRGCTCIRASGRPILAANRSRAKTSG